MTLAHRPARMLVVLAGLLLALAGLAACGGDDDDLVTGDDPDAVVDGDPGGDSAADCESTTEDCDDTADGGAAGTCLAGAEDCDDTGPDAEPPGPPTAGMCAADAPDCVDTVDPGGDEFPTEAAREQARALLGAQETDLPPDVRVSERDGESFPLTEDYVLGRLTVVLRQVDDGTHIVSAVTVELPDGPETFTLE